MKVKIIHYLHFQLNWGKCQGEENTLIGCTLTINLRATAKPKNSPFYLHAPYPLNTSFHFVTFFLLFYTSLLFTTDYTQVLPVLFESDAFKNRWNLIKNSELFLILWTLPESTMFQKRPS